MRHRRILILGLVLLVTALPAPSLHSAQYVTYETVTVAATSIGLTATTISPVGMGQMTTCSMRLETAQIRYRWDGTAPTSTVGTLLEVGDVLVIDSHEDARRFRGIRTGAASGVLQVHCWR